jgi:hypothetical protein
LDNILYINLIPSRGRKLKQKRGERIDKDFFQLIADPAPSHGKVFTNLLIEFIFHIGVNGELDFVFVFQFKAEVAEHFVEDAAGMLRPKEVKNDDIFTDSVEDFGAA